MSNYEYDGALARTYTAAMVEMLEARRMLSGIDTSSVALVPAYHRRTTLNRHRAIWIIAHGDDMNAAEMLPIAQAVQAQLPANQWQVVVVDWSVLASSGLNAAKAGMAVGDRLTQMIQAAHVPASRINLMGYSMGGTVIGRIAQNLKTSATQVNRIVGIDPAVGRIQPAEYAQDSAYSIVFAAHDAIVKDYGSASADQAVLLSGLDSDTDIEKHGDAFAIVTTMWLRDAGVIDKGNDGVSGLFSINQILNGPEPAWKPDQYDGVYDANMTCGYQAGLGNDLGPLSLTYRNSRGHTRVIT